MTVLLALVGPPSAWNDEEVGARLRAARPGAGTTVVHRVAPDVVVGVATPEWDGVAADRMASDGRYTVIAHAALYYRRDLSAALAKSGHPPLTTNGSPAEAILAALRAWGWRCVDYLEGEFSFIVWDSRERVAFAARDHAGARSLFATRAGDGIVIASSLRLIRSVPGCGSAWNLLALAEDAANIDLAFANETAFAAVDRIPAGHALTWSAGRPLRFARWWQIPVFEQDSGVPFEEGAEELRRLLADAVAERADLRRGTVVMLSGGYDSTAVYGAGNWRLGATTGPALASVSFSHAQGDPGREDELIEATTARWGGKPHFIATESVPALESSAERARNRDEPFYHLYELWNRALARGCRVQGGRVALNGNGGDPWFSTSPRFLGDLLRTGHLREFRREWHALMGKLTWYRVFKVAVQPNLPTSVLTMLAAVRGGRGFSDPHVREIPDWVSEPLRRDRELLRRRHIEHPRRRGEGISAADRTWFLHSAFAERTTALVFSICQREGIEIRTPLMDDRIVRFAATRPRWESNSGRQNKHLLRRSMQGLLPEAVVAPRTARTGLPVTYLRRTLRAHLLEARETFTGGMFLAELGIVDHRKMLAEVDGFLGGQWDDYERAANVLAAAQAEWWLRSFDGSSPA